MEERGSTLSVAERKGTKMAAKWSPARGVVRSQPFPLLRSSCPKRPGAVKGAPLLGAAKRTLDGEDRSEMIAEEGKAGRKVGEKWSGKMVPSPAASNILHEPIEYSLLTNKLRSLLGTSAAAVSARSGLW